MHLVALILLSLAADEPKPLSFAVSVAAGKLGRADEPVRVPITVPAGTGYRAALLAEGKPFAPVALLEPGLLAGSAKPPAGMRRLEAWFVLPRLAAGKTLALTLALRPGKQSGPLAWARQPDGRSVVLMDGEVPVLGYQMPELDESTAKAREATFKPFHEAYLDGKKITKGVGGLYTHHRGLFYGFMKATYGKDTVDIWHCKKQTHQASKRIVQQSPPNAVLGRHRAAIDWNGVAGKTFARELREVAAIPLPGGLLLEFDSRLTPTGPDVKLDGDPQHAGFHFRASNEVDKAKKQTYFLRPWGVGEKGKEANWPADKKQAGLPWLGMSFVIDGQRYTAAYLDHPSNPKPAMFSERTYGRLGSYFVATATKEKPLTVRYRVWLQKGEMKPARLEGLSRSFTDPAAVKAVAR